MATTEADVVVAGLDGSDAARAAARWAASEAELRGASLRLVHVVAAPTEVGYPEPLLLAPQVTDGMRARAGRLLEAAADRLIKEHPGLHIETLQRDGAPAEVLVDQSRHATASVLGAHGAGRLSGFLFGSVAARVAAHGHGPVVIARPSPGDTLDATSGAVVLGVDGSAGAHAAAGFAFEEAALRGACLDVIHTWNDKPLEHALGSYPLEINVDGIDTRELELLEAELSGWQQKYPQVVVRIRVVRGHPAPVLLHCATSPGAGPMHLMVVGTRGRGGFAGLRIGSTSQAVMTHAPCTVAVVHQQQGRDGSPE